MGLIDADLLKSDMASGEIVIDEDVLKCDTMHEMLLYLLKKVEDCMIATIDAQPTAYDAEAVVRELEELKGAYERQYEKDHDHRNLGAFIGVRNAIKIVKRGGRNE